MWTLDTGMIDRVFGHNPSIRFKGGGGPDPQPPPSSQMGDTEIKKYARKELYPMVTSGLKGKGYGEYPTTAQRSRSLYSGLDKAYGTAQSDLESTMARTLDPADARVKNFMTNTLSREYTTKKDDIARSLRAEKVSDQDMSMGLAADYLGQEKRMALSGAQMYNQALQTDITRQQQMGTFGSNVASGIGSMAGSLASAYQIDQRYAQKAGT